MSRRILLFLVLTTYLLISFQLVTNPHGTSNIARKQTIQYFRTNAVEFAKNIAILDQDIQNLSSDTATLHKALSSLVTCRLQYKKIEFFNAYFFASETRMINAAPVYEVEEPTLELVEPMGLQQMEALLFEENYLEQKPELILQVALLNSTASVVPTLLYNFDITDAQILESLRVNLIRIITLSISGYDAPELKTGIQEAAVALQTMNEILIPFFDANVGAASFDLKKQINQAANYLEKNSEFDTFNRMEFLKNHALPLQKTFKEAIQSWHLEIKTAPHLDYNMDHLFSKNAIHVDTASIAVRIEKNKQKLGKILFTENALSGKGDRSCATCHIPDRFFNDNLIKSAAIITDTILPRNTPTLLYASAQHFQFWDGRAENLTNQIVQVIFNSNEMNGNSSRITTDILKEPQYQNLFLKAFPKNKKSDFTVLHVAEAIGSFIKTLQPFNSPFDQYINGDTTALTDRQINGFNVFMGKAQCGTCHFLPYFNSLLPPYYAISEVEILGTPANVDFDYPIKDKDKGRFDLYAINFYDQAFKTPTVRNSEKTAPYMHNGAFATLKEVVEFYDRGGGKGIGLTVPDQTLSAKPLNLTVIEKEDICLFIESLTDKI